MSVRTHIPYTYRTGREIRVPPSSFEPAARRLRGEHRYVFNTCSFPTRIIRNENVINLFGRSPSPRNEADASFKVIL